MNEKPKALRLADALETAEISYTSMVKAAAELRRLHAELQEADKANAWLQEVNARVSAQRDELLEALKKISAIENKDYGSDWEEIEEARDIADAAIAKATGETK